MEEDKTGGVPHEDDHHPGVDHGQSQSHQDAESTAAQAPVLHGEQTNRMPVIHQWMDMELNIL